MLSKVVPGLLIVMLCVVGLAGCGKKSEQPAPAPEQTQTSAQTQTKTAAEYEAEAKKEITEENMDDELDKLEQAIEGEAAQE